MKSLFPDPSQDEQDHMHRLAAKTAYRLGAGHEDRDALIEDLEMAGWIAFYRFFELETRWLKASDAMSHAWCLWRFGVTFRGKEQVVRTVHMVPIEDWTLVDSAQQRIEHHLEARDTLDKLGQLIATRPRYRKLSSALRGIALAEGSPLTPAERASCGIKSPAVYSQQKQLIRRLATNLQRDAV